MESSRLRWRPDRGKVLKDPKGVIIDPSLKRGPKGFVLCRFCSKETSNEYTTFCGESCIHKFKQQTQPKYLRQTLFDRDKGICSFCERDCQSIYQKACTLTKIEERISFINGLNDPLFLKKTSMCLRNATISFKTGMFWEATHIIDVQDGGGSSDLSNFRTLCVPCHHRETKAKSFFKKIQKEAECPTGTSIAEITRLKPQLIEKSAKNLDNKSNTEATQSKTQSRDHILGNSSCINNIETIRHGPHSIEQVLKHPTCSSNIETTHLIPLFKEHFFESVNSTTHTQTIKSTTQMYKNRHLRPLASSSNLEVKEKNGVLYNLGKTSKRRLKFSQLEIDTLLIGMDKYGNQWAKIKQEYSTIFSLRSSVDLKDKARNLQRKAK